MKAAVFALLSFAPMNRCNFLAKLILGKLQKCKFWRNIKKSKNIKQTHFIKDGERFLHFLERSMIYIHNVSYSPNQNNIPGTADL